MTQVIVIGGGQAGLAAGYFLRQSGIPYLVLEAKDRIGDNWRDRWDSLRLFSPARYNALPGMPFPAPPGSLPDKDEAAGYLEAYARKFDLNIRTGVLAHSLDREEGRFMLETSAGAFRAPFVIVATGPYRTPRIPAFAKELPGDIRQLHSSEYRNPAQLPDGPVLVVGSGASGSQIADEIALDRKVYLAGRTVGTLPRKFLGKDIFWWLYKTGAITVRRDSWMGRRMTAKQPKGDLHVGKSLKRIVRERGIIRLGKATGQREGVLTFACGNSAPDIRAIVWATGYRQDHSWIRLPVFREDGAPRHVRGDAGDGLFFLGLRFLYRANSSLMGGVGADAEHIAEEIRKRLNAPAP